jgi:hypothetical protein
MHKSSLALIDAVRRQLLMTTPLVVVIEGDPTQHPSAVAVVSCCSVCCDPLIHPLE